MYYKKSMNYGSFKDGSKVQVRFSPEQYDYLCMCACNMDCSMSDFIRMIVDANMRISKGEQTNAHKQTHKHH